MRASGRVRVGLHTLLILICLAAVAAASDIVPLEPAPGASTTPTGINARGDVVGFFVSGGHVHGFLRSKGKYTVIDVPGAQDTLINGLNDRGDLVGQTEGGGFLLRNGRMTPLLSPNGERLSPRGINNRGDIVGVYTTFIPLFEILGFWLDAQGTFHANRGANESTYSGINDAGDIVGSVGIFLRFGFLIDRHGTRIDVSVGGGLLNGISTLPTGINERGVIVGTERTIVNPDRGFVRNRAGIVEYVEIPGASSTHLTAINARGDIVGWYRIGTVTYGFLLPR